MLYILLYAIVENVRHFSDFRLLVMATAISGAVRPERYPKPSIIPLSHCVRNVFIIDQRSRNGGSGASSHLSPFLTGAKRNNDFNAEAQRAQSTQRLISMVLWPRCNAAFQAASKPVSVK